MPGHERRRARLLDEEVRRPAQKVGSVEVLHGVEDAGMANDVGKELEDEVRLVAQFAAEWPALGPFECL